MKLNIVWPKVTLPRLRGAAMIGTILLPVLLLIGAAAAGDSGGNTGGDSLGPAIFLVTVIASGLFSGFVVVVLTVGIHISSEVRTRLDYVELCLSLGAITSGFVWWFQLGELFWMFGITAGAVGLLYLVIAARVVYHADSPA